MPEEEKTGRNELCPCGSGKKHKKCCGAPDPTFDNANLGKVLHILLVKVGGLSIPADLLEKYPDMPFKAKYDRTRKTWTLSAIVPEQKGPALVAPSKRLIMPN